MSVDSQHQFLTNVQVKKKKSDELINCSENRIMAMMVMTNNPFQVVRCDLCANDWDFSLDVRNRFAFSEFHTSSISGRSYAHRICSTNIDVNELINFPSRRVSIVVFDFCYTTFISHSLFPPTEILLENDWQSNFGLT